MKNKMKVIIPLVLIFGLKYTANAQGKEYFDLTKKADSLYRIKDYKNSASTYSKAFASNNWKGFPADRYNAACSWSLIGNADSAFFNLNRIANKSNYKEYNHIINDDDLISLHKDARWLPLIEKVKQNQEKSEASLNKPLIAKLDTIYKDDQTLRKQTDSIAKKYGFESNEVKGHIKKAQILDSINLIKVKAILDKDGWLGADVVGQQGNTTLFLVIQHADIKTQEKYLPMMRASVTEGKASGSSLALLEDRVLLRTGKKQIYGSQIGRDLETGLSYVSPLEDPDNVDKRRAAVDLEPLKDYVARFNIKWDIEQYKKDLPSIEKKFKALMEKYGKQ